MALPGIAGMLVQGAQQSAQNVGQDLNQGAQLAQTIENISQQKEKLEMQKQELMVGKADKIMSAIEKGSQFKDKAAQNLYFKNYVPGMVKALKMEEFFNPELLQYVQQSPEVRNKLIGLRLDIQDKIQSGQLKGAEIFNYAQSKLSPEELPLLDTDSLLEQQKFAASEEGKSFRSTQQAQAAAGRQQQSQAFSAAESDRVKTKQLADKLLELNVPAVESTTKKIEAMIPGGLDKYDGKSQIPGIGGADALIPSGRLSQKQSANRQLALDLGNQYIKMTTGSGMSNDEAFRLLAGIGLDVSPTEGGGFRMVFNGTKSSADFVNGVRNLKDKMMEIKNTAKAGVGPRAAQQFEENKKALEGSPKKEVKPTPEWKNQLKAQKGAISKLKPEQKKRLIDGLAAKFNISTEEIKKELGE